MIHELTISTTRRSGSYSDDCGTSLSFRVFGMKIMRMKSKKQMAAGLSPRFRRCIISFHVILIPTHCLFVCACLIVFSACSGGGRIRTCRLQVMSPMSRPIPLPRLGSRAASLPPVKGVPRTPFQPLYFPFPVGWQPYQPFRNPEF